MKYILKYDVNKKDITNDILVKKGIIDPERYLSIGKKDENNPYDLKNIEKGCKLLIHHLEQGNHIYIQPDSDLDGYMSSSMLYNYIKLFKPNANISWHVHEGKQHGIVIDYIPHETSLVIVPDAGSNNYEEHQKLAEMGMDVLVLDHHECEYESEYAVVINNQLGNYPNKNLSGGGVTYKFLQVMDNLLQIKNSEQFVDMAAVSIVGDMMDLKDYENRYLVKQGLLNIKNIGLKQLIEQQAYSIGDTTKLTPESIAWYIVPLVNALVRVGTDSEKELLFRAFTEGNHEISSTKRGAKGTVETISEQAVRNCVNARSRQNRAKEKAINDLDLKIQNNELYKNQVIFVNVEDDELFDSTLTGLIAMNILSKYKKPTIVARLSKDGNWKGSARGNSATALKDLKAFFANSKLFEFVEGHPNAFGLSIPDSNVSKLVDYSNEELKDVEFNENTYEVDLIYSNKEDCSSAIGELSRLKAIWGQGVEEPLIVVENIQLFPEDVQFIGKTKDTVKFTHRGVTFIKFKATDLVNKISSMKDSFSMTVIGKANMNEWNGNFTPQLMLEDYQIRDTKYDF